MKDAKKTKKELLEELAGLRAGSEAVKSRLAAEEKLQAERQRFYDFLDCLPVFAYLQSPDYSIRYANRYFKRLYGEPGKKPCYEAIWKRTAPCEQCPTCRVFETGRPEVWESHHPSNGRAFRVYDFPFTDSAGTPLVLEISLDLTENKRGRESLVVAEKVQEGLFQHTVRANTEERTYGRKLPGSDRKDEMGRQA